MREDLLTIEFCFPKASDGATHEAFVSHIMDLMRDTGSIEYAGYMEDEELSADLSDRIGQYKPEDYKLFSETEKKQIQVSVLKTLEKCHTALPHPLLPIIVFVFPWFSDKEEYSLFGNVNAFAVHESVMHLFVRPDSSLEQLENTVAHEYNHLIYYHNFPAETYTLLEHIIMEGLAEHFRKETVGGDTAPWSKVLDEDSTESELMTISDLLDSHDSRVHKDVLFGNKKYKRWTGYSIGYWLIRKYRAKYPDISWENVMLKGANEIAKEIGVRI